ncbi:Sn1-specific diacylglycerol lipase alpha, partial [Myotis davidii]
FVILSVVLFGLVYNPHEACSLNLVDHGRGYLGILLSCMIAEMAIIWLSMRGGILYTEPRESMQYVLYVRLAILVIEFIYAIVGIVWLTQYYTSCNDLTAKNGKQHQQLPAPRKALPLEPCFLCPSRPRFAPGVTIEEDNCCGCNAIAIRRHFLDENLTAVYETPFYVAVDHDKKKVVISIRGTLSPKDALTDLTGDAERLPVEGHHGTWLGHKVYETPFYVAVDHDKKKVVISIRGTLSPKDALTDLTGDAERLPVEGHHGTWLGHKGMVLSAEYIKKKLEQEMVLSQAFGRDLGRGTKHYGLIVVGHSLGAGTAAILSFLLRPQYPTLKCFAYSPPGGLLSEDAMEYSKEFVTAVVLGKDLVPRQIGLSQLEGFRRQLLDVLQRSTKPKWRIIVGATKCIPKSELPEEAEVTAMANTRLWTHPSDLTIALSASTPLYPPGRIIHVVHNHPAEQCCCCEQEEPTYFAIWGDNKAFNEVIISPAMLHEHLPYVVMEGLNKVRLGTGGPSAAAPPAGSAAPDCRRGCGCSEGLAAPPGGLGGAESRLVSWSLHPALSRGRVARGEELQRRPGACP